MRRRNVVAISFGLAALGAVAIAGCAARVSGGGEQVRAGAGGEVVAPALDGLMVAPAEAAPVAETTAPAPSPALAAPAIAPVPMAQTSDATASASIEVRFQRDGARSTAQLVGDSATSDLPIEGGVAIFTGLTAGSYELSISNTSDPAPGTPNATIGSAFDAARYGSFAVSSGQHLVLSCDDSTCTVA